MNYSLPREIFIEFEEVFKAETKAIRESLGTEIRAIHESLGTEIRANREFSETETKSIRGLLQAEIKSTRELFEERFKMLDFKLNIVIAIAALSLTFFNPVLLNFLAKVFKL